MENQVTDKLPESIPKVTNPMSDSGVSISSVKMLELEDRIQAKCDGKWLLLTATNLFHSYDSFFQSRNSASLSLLNQSKNLTQLDSPPTFSAKRTEIERSSNNRTSSLM